MSCSWPLERQGFVDHYMVSGPKAEKWSTDHTDRNQLRYEAWLRQVIADHAPVENTTEIRLGENSRLGILWRYYSDIGSGFVDVSTFYSLMRKVTFDVVAALISPRDMTVKAVLWSYSAVDLYCNGVKAGEISHPVYKPIERCDVTLPLKAGVNILYMACQNAGVRDTRSNVGIQLLEGLDELRVTLADQTPVERIRQAEVWMSGAVLEADCIRFPGPVEAEVSWRPVIVSEDFADVSRLNPWRPVQDTTQILLPEESALIRVRADIGVTVMERVFERTEKIRPVYGDTEATVQKNLETIFRRIASVQSCDRGEGLHFPIAPQLARKYLGMWREDDDDMFAYMVDLIEKRVDCADFILCGLLRFIRCYGIPAGQEETVRHAILNFRYWMTMEGQDCMCFWSENHALMFYENAMIAGSIYPDAYFPRAKMTGRELEAFGRRLTEQWFDDVEEAGFEEFLSTVYMCVTFAALLGVVDFAGEPLSSRARAVTDRMLEMLALHIFKNGFIAPMGRVYRNALYPFDQGAIALMNMLNPRLPYSFGEGWLGYFAGSSYQPPEGLAALMEQPAETSYTTGSARIMLEKNTDYCLTSVASPREPGFVRWQNKTFDPAADPETHSYTKSFNERFHGTTCFEPGTYGYQQHMWFAALDGEAILFANHPGSMSEGGDMRPGYWHGNGVMPALKQRHGVLGGVYVIPKEHPLHYIHLYCPECRYDEVRRGDHWLFLRKGSGYLALWCSGKLEPYAGMNTGCELRVYGDETALLCVCGDRSFKDLDAFEGYARAMQPAYDVAGRTLTAREYSLTWTGSSDKTQYL